MSKRTAQGPQGSKESDLFEFNMSSTPDDKPQRATAAQMANRKIKDVRRRRPNTSGAGASFGGPFNSLDPNTVSGTPSAPQPATNGFTFGQSQSFPGAGSTPSQPSQNGSSPFAFGQGSGSSSFNFGFGGSGAASNPFASMNTGSSAPSADGSNFSGFKGNLFNIPATSSPAPAQQSLPSGGLFGAGQQQNTPSGGGLFGSTSTPSTQPASAAPTAGGIFGQTSGSTTPSTNVFGQSTTSKPTAFGQSTAFGESMQTSPDSKQSKPSIFGAGTTSSGFGASSSFASPGTGSLFGTSTSKPAETPAKPLFGAKPAEQATPSTSLFGATTQPSSAATPAPSTTPAAASTTPAPSTSLFGATASSTASPAAPFQNLFGTPAPSTTTKHAEKDEKKPEESHPKPAFQFGASTSGATPSLFSKSETTAAPSAPAGGLFQPPSTGSLFAPKPAAAAEQDKPAPNEGNPFASLFAPKPTTPSKPTTEQKPLPSPAPFSGLLSPKPSEEAKKSEQEKPTPSAPLFSAPTSTSTPPAPSLFAPQSPAFSLSTSEKPQAPASPVPAPAPSPFKINGATSTSKPPMTTENAIDSLSKATPSKMPASLDKKHKTDVELLHRMRILNESFQREISRLNPAADDFDRLIEFYTRVRETIGAPVGGKRKSRDDEGESPAESASKKMRPFGVPSDGASAVKSSTPSFGASTSTKRKSTEDDTSAAPAEKRMNGDSTTASIFAQSFSKSKTSESGPESTAASPAKPSTPDTSKPALFSTTPTTSPAKPLFSASTTTKEASSSTPLFSTTPKPASAAPSTSSAPANPFVLKPASGPSSASAAPPPGLPKFGSGTTNFFAQFKAQAEKDAEKEKAKRKAEDYDSEEEDEAEWERRDAEEREKKLKELQSQQAKRSKFIPGKGFVFEDEASDVTEKKDDKAATAPSSGASVFDKKSASPAKSNNIFGHLSATPSEAEEDDADDTEEASDGDEGDATRESSFGATSEDASARDAETSEAESKGVSGSVGEFSANESGDDGDLTKAIQNSKKATEPASGGRSLFDRVQYDDDGKPKRQNEEQPKNPFSSLFSNTKFSSANSTSSNSNPFTFGKSQSEQGDASASKPATPNIFGAAKPPGSLFGSPTPSASGASTPSIFAASQDTPKATGTDNTWKPNSPIKFANSSATPASNEDSGAADAPKPFSTLFGGDGASDSKASAATGTPSLGFSFGGPSQQSSSFLTPSNISSATPSRASTPGVTSDTGAEESGDGEAAEKLPQVDLARSRAGEENEDVVMETRARGLKFVDKSWESQGVGFLRVLKDRTTSRGRVILRADPSGNVVLNTALMKAIEYKVSGNNVQFLVPKAEGPPEQWALRVKKEDVERLGAAMQETKT